jgi:8-oxo-dGTP pyrophosphatase MutT (NUDIX family)
MIPEKSSRSLRRVEEISAGGFVLAGDGSGMVALIAKTNRQGRLEWCVPKGHPENQESYEVAAIREIAEETGLEAEIVVALGDIQYDFSAGNKLISKTVYHFLMRQTGGTLTVENDPHHEASEAGWFHVDDLVKQLSHENERRMARGVQEWMARNS